MPGFSILIIGGGLGGLAAAITLGQKGHKVTVLEATAKLQTIGGAISIPPNASRVFSQLGLLDRLLDAAEQEGKTTKGARFNRYNGEYLFTSWRGHEDWTFPLIQIHRAPFQALLVEAAQEAGAVIQVDTKVVSIGEGGPSPVAITKDGRRFKADLIIGADGAKSNIRRLLYPDVQLKSSINCYRAVIDGSVLRADPELLPLLDSGTLWWGPDRTIVGLAVQDKAFYSIECAHPGDTGTAGDWRKPGDIEEMKKMYSDFEPRVRKLIASIKPEDLLVWKLNQLPELETWVFGSGKVVLLAAHAVTPYAGQGHAMATEDSACLAECLSRATSVADIPQALRLFESIRKPRVKAIGDYALIMEHVMQMPDGEAQQKRDEMFRNIPMGAAQGWDGKHIDDVPGMHPDPLFNPYMLGYDVVDHTRRKLDELWVSKGQNGSA